MPIDVTCPGCQTVYPVPEALAGKTIKCKGCGEMMEVPDAPPAAKPVAARPVAARPVPAKPLPTKAAPRAVVDDEDDEPATPVRRTRDDDDDVTTKEKKKSSLPLVLGGVLGFLALVGVGFGALYGAGLIGGKGSAAVAENTVPLQPLPDNPPIAAGAGGGPRVPAPVEDTSVQQPAPTTTPTKKGEPASSSPPANSVQAPPRGPDAPRPPLLPTVTTPVRPSPAETKGDSPPPPTRDTPDQKTLDKCKNAAIYIEVETSRMRGSGSAWCGVEPGLVFTNAHVLNMLSPGSTKPTKITLFINPGTPKEREIPHQRVEILAVDRAMDLALLRITGEADLPPPLPTRPSTELRDLEKLVLIGYPRGRTLSMLNKSTKPPAVSLGSAIVQTLRRDDDGNIYSVQMQSSMVQGNSGGPIVDADGNVTAVAVAGLTDKTSGGMTAITYGVPTEYVTGLLAGRVADVEYGQAYRADGKIHIPVTVNCLDPMNRLKEVGIGFWMGDAPAKDAAKKPRPPGPSRTGTEPSDSHYGEATLTYKHDKEKQLATGEIVLPEAEPGRTYWAQPYYSNALVSKYWLAGNPVKLPGPPVDRVPADLIVKYKPNTKRALTLSNTFALSEYEQGEGEDKSERIQLEIGVKGHETVMAPQQNDQTAHAILRLNYEKFDLSALRGEQKLDEAPKELVNLITQAMAKTVGYSYVNRTGLVYRTQSDTRSLTPPFNRVGQVFNDQIMETLKAVSVTLPNGRVEPMHKWSATHLYQMTLGFAEPVQVSPEGAEPKGPKAKGPNPKGPRVRTYKFNENFTYTYLGTRVRGGTKEGVVRIEGTIATAPGAKTDEGATGQFKGYVYVDLDSGMVVEAEVSKELELDTSGDGQRKRLSGINTYKLSRGGSVSAQ